MRAKPLILVIFLAILQWQSSESASSSSASAKDTGVYFLEGKNNKIEGSAFADTNSNADAEDTDAKGEDDEDAFVISSSGSGSIGKSKVEEPVVYISKPTKTKKPIYVTKPVTKRPQTKPTTKPGKKYSAKENPVVVKADDRSIENHLPDFDFKPTEGSKPTVPRRKDSEEQPEMVDDNKTSNEIGLMGRKTDELPASFFAKPGILFAVIGGAVVGLLCAILLVMFIVYRMRKKDEGSYPLDEPRRSANSNSYMRTSGKEFYA